MRANYKYDRATGETMKNKMVLTKEDISKCLDEEWKERTDKIYEEVKSDVANQVLAVVFTSLNKDFGFGKKRLLKVKDSIEAYFKIMNEHLFYQQFSTLDCLEYLKSEFGIDLDKEELSKK